MFDFWEIWPALFSWNTCFEIRLFALLLTVSNDKMQVSAYVIKRIGKSPINFHEKKLNFPVSIIIWVYFYLKAVLLSHLQKVMNLIQILSTVEMLQ